MSTSFISNFIATSLGYQDQSIAAEVQISAAEKSQFDTALNDQLDLGKADLKDFYKELDYQTLNGANLHFGASLEELVTKDQYDALYNGAAGNHLAYAQKRTAVLADLIKVMTAAQQNPKLLDHFLDGAQSAAAAAELGIEGSVHLQELKGAVREAIKGDPESESIYASHDKAYIYDKTIYAATLAELQKRHNHLSQINGGPSSNFKKHGIAGGAADFGLTGLAHSAGLGYAHFRKVDVIGKDGKLVHDLVQNPKTLKFEKVPRKQFAITRFVKTVVNPKNWLSGLARLVKPIGTLLTKIPGPPPLKIAGAVALGLVGLSKIYCDVQDGAGWTEKIAETWNSFNLKSAGKVALGFFIPDVGKFFGHSIFENNDQQFLKEGVVASL
ncbi:MAG: hypothetical protein OXU45_00400 [Candidatus Melainabacteria bacterium]|nr:hypothetical protein [Candidatus Melainabacteria bacterium]